MILGCFFVTAALGEDYTSMSFSSSTSPSSLHILIATTISGYRSSSVARTMIKHSRHRQLSQIQFWQDLLPVALKGQPPKYRAISALIGVLRTSFHPLLVAAGNRCPCASTTSLPKYRFDFSSEAARCGLDYSYGKNSK